MKTFVYMDDNLIGDWCKSWRVTEQKKNGESFIHRQGAFNRLDEIKIFSASIYHAGRENTISNCSTAGTCPRKSKKSWPITG